MPNGVAGQDLLFGSDGILTAAGPPRGVGFGPPVANGHLLRHPLRGPSGISILGVADAVFNGVNSTVAPGEIVSIYGTGLGPQSGIVADAPGGTIAAVLGGTAVSFDGIPAPILYSSANQVNVLVPYGVAPGRQAPMRVDTPGASSQILPLTVVSAQPNVVTVLNSDGSVNAPYNAAKPGSLVTIFVSGAGALNPTLPDGTIGATPAPAPELPVQVDFSYVVSGPHGPSPGTVTVAPAFAGANTGTVINLLRIDVQVPPLPTLASGFQISVRAGDARSPSFPLPVSTATGN